MPFSQNPFLSRCTAGYENGCTPNLLGSFYRTTIRRRVTNFRKIAKWPTLFICLNVRNVLPHLLELSPAYLCRLISCRTKGVPSCETVPTWYFLYLRQIKCFSYRIEKKMLPPKPQKAVHRTPSLVADNEDSISVFPELLCGR